MDNKESPQGATKVERIYEVSLPTGNTMTIKMSVALTDYNPSDFRKAIKGFAAISNNFYIHELAKKLREFGSIEESQ